MSRCLDSPWGLISADISFPVKESIGTLSKLFSFLSNGEQKKRRKKSGSHCREDEPSQKSLCRDGILEFAHLSFLTHSYFCYCWCVVISWKVPGKAHEQIGLVKVTEDLTGVLFFPFVLGNTFENVDIDNQHRLKEKPKGDWRNWSLLTFLVKSKWLNESC